jgi:hypothetical protein
MDKFEERICLLGAGMKMMLAMDVFFSMNTQLYICGISQRGELLRIRKAFLPA